MKNKRHILSVLYTKNKRHILSGLYAIAIGILVGCSDGASSYAKYSSRGEMDNMKETRDSIINSMIEDINTNRVKDKEDIDRLRQLLSDKAKHGKEHKIIDAQAKAVVLEDMSLYRDSIVYNIIFRDTIIYNFIIVDTVIYKK